MCHRGPRQHLGGLSIMVANHQMLLCAGQLVEDLLQPVEILCRMTITMPSDMAETLRQTVAGGEYASTSEVVREALRDWTRSRDAELRDLETLRDAIKAGLDSGPGIPADQVFAELRARYADKS